MQTVLVRKLEKFSSLLNLTPDAFDSKNLKSIEDFVEAVIFLFIDIPKLFHVFLFRIIDWRIKTFTQSSLSSLDGCENDGLIEDMVDSGQLNTWLKNLEFETSLAFPKPVLTTASWFVQLMLVLVPIILLLVLLVFNFELVLPIYGVIKVGVFFLIIAVPYLVALLLFPNFFKPNKLPKVVTYKDLVDQAVWLNQYHFIKDDYKMTKDELVKLFDAL